VEERVLADELDAPGRGERGLDDEIEKEIES